eukprot:6132143-Amphidinium_carterae.1
MSAQGFWCECRSQVYCSFHLLANPWLGCRHHACRLWVFRSLGPKRDEAVASAAPRQAMRLPCDAQSSTQHNS